MTDIQKILRKKKKTGSDLGRVAVANMLIGYQNIINGEDPSTAYPVSTATIQECINKLDAVEGRIYTRYITMYKWLTTNLQASLAQQEQALHNISELIHIIRNADVAENVFRYMETQPVIMTEKQYKDAVERQKADFFKTELNENSILDLICYATDYYIDLLQSNPQKKNPLKPLRKKLQHELVTDPHILNQYYKINGLGYYTLEDGTRSDQVTPEEWNSLINPIIDSLLKADLMGTQEAQDVREQIEINRTVAEAVIMLETGVSKKKAKVIRNEIEIENGSRKKTEWHFYSDTPQGITKWDIIEHKHLHRYYYNPEATEEEAVELAKAFVKEFPELSSVMVKEIAGKYPDLSWIKNRPVEEWIQHAHFISTESLFNMDFCDLNSKFLNDTFLFRYEKQIVFNGIAILRPNLNNTHVSDTGNYQPTDLKELFSESSLESFFPEHASFENSISDVDLCRNTLIASLYYMRAFNTLLDTLASMFDLEELKIIKVAVEDIEDLINSYNKEMLLLYRDTASINYQDEALKQKKLAVLRQYLYPIDLDKTVIPRKRLDKTKEAIKDLQGFSSEELNPLYLLMVYDEDAIEEELRIRKEEEGAVNG